MLPIEYIRSCIELARELKCTGIRVTETSFEVGLKGELVEFAMPEAPQNGTLRKEPTDEELMFGSSHG